MSRDDRSANDDRPLGIPRRLADGEDVDVTAERVTRRLLKVDPRAAIPDVD